MKITMVCSKMNEVSITKTLEFYVNSGTEVTAEQHKQLVHYMYKWGMLDQKKSSFSIYVSLEDYTTVFMYRVDKTSNFLHYFISEDKDIVKLNVDLSWLEIIGKIYEVLSLFSKTQEEK